MSDAYAVDRFMQAAHAFQALEAKLREDTQGVDPKKIDAVLIDLHAAIPGLDGEDLGRALVFKAYVTHWRFLTELGKKNVFDVIGAPVDPRLVEALDEARRGRVLLRTANDIKWAEETVKHLEEYMR
jgi:hypothetical protein